MITTQIVPAILVNTVDQYKSSIAVCQSFAKRIQVDITDGTFAANTTIPLTNVFWPQGWEIDLHMMVGRPSEFLPAILQMKPTRCILHAEANEDLLPIFAQLKEAGIKTGVALMKPTFPGAAKHYIEAVDHVLIFAGDLGRQGGTADMMQIEKVPLIRAIKQDVEIGWDGGANMNNVRAIAHAGVDIINVGSAITTAQNPAESFRQLTEELDKRGVVLP